MKPGELLYVKVDECWQPATYEYRIERGEPLGQHSVMMKDGSGRRVVCSCCTDLAAGVVSHHEAICTRGCCCLACHTHCDCHAPRGEPHAMRCRLTRACPTVIEESEGRRG